MKKFSFLAGTLTIAAVLAMTVSCSKDQISVPVESTQESAPQTIFVSVGADINDGPQTKSAVYYDSENKLRILQFTEGDRLYVNGDVSDYYTTAEDGTDYCEYIVAGYLSLDPTTLSADGRKGTFSGDLSVYQARVEVDEQDEWMIDEWEWDEEVPVTDPDTGDEYIEYIHHDEVGHYETVRYVEIDYPDVNIVTNLDGIFNDTSDPLSECSNIVAMLVHRDAGSLFDVNDWKWGSLDDIVAPDVETLMTRALSVYGMYRSSTKDFTLFISEYEDQSILNCSIDGLTPNARYMLFYHYDESNAFSGSSFREMDTITTDNSGHASFAFFGRNYHERDWNQALYHGLRLSNVDDEYDVKLVDLGGPKRLTNKVYNISRTATDDPFAPIRPLKPTLTRSDGLNAGDFDIADDEYEYEIHGTYDEGTGDYAQDIALGISGNFGNYRINLNNGGIVTLGGNGIARYSNGYSCIFSWGDVTIMLDSDYTIQVLNSYCAISSYEGTIKLGSVSGSHTLTLVTNEEDDKGFECYNYPTMWDNNLGCDVEQPASTLAIDGCSVELTSSTDNGDGTYTFVYTVTKL